MLFRSLMIELCAERMTGDAVQHFVSADMQWGLETEPAAKAAYEADSGTLLTACGFYLHPTIQYFGATPDALVDDDAVFECKCPRSTTHVAWMLEGKMPEQHKPQVLAQLACTGRNRAVFVSFDPRMPPKHQLFVVNWTPDRAELDAVEDAARSFLAELDAMFKKVTES